MWLGGLVELSGPFGHAGHAGSRHSHLPIHAAKFHQSVIIFTQELCIHSGNSKLYFGHDPFDRISLTQLTMHCPWLKGVKILVIVRC